MGNHNAGTNSNKHYGKIVMYQIALIKNTNVPFKLRYPTGKKDGNKLGKRKRTMRSLVCLKMDNVLMCHPDIFEEVKRNTVVRSIPILVDEIGYFDEKKHYFDSAFN